VVNFTRQPLYPRGKNLPAPIGLESGWAQSRSGRSGEERNSQPLAGIEPPNPDRSVRSQSLYRLDYPGSSHRTTCSERTAILSMSLNVYFVKI
jgi:hypothetical protein